MLVRSCPPLRHPAADPSLPPEGDRIWWLVQTHPQQERMLAADLLRAGVPCYLPLGARSGVTPRGRRWSRVGALFPCYLFALLDESRHPALDDSRRVAKVRRIEGQDRFRRELAALDAVCSAPGEVRLGPIIHAQSRVRIASGIYRGLEGVVRAMGNRDRVYVNLHEVGMSASVEFDLAQLEPAR